MFSGSLSLARATTASILLQRSPQRCDRNVRGDWAISLRRCDNTNEDHAEQKHHACDHPAQGRKQISVVHHHSYPLHHHPGPRQQASLIRRTIWRQIGGGFLKRAAQTLAVAALECPRWVTCGRRPDKNFLTACSIGRVRSRVRPVCAAGSGRWP